MIKNDRQYQLTKVQARRLREALTKLLSGEAEPSDWLDVEIAALDSQLSSLQKEIDEYETLRGGTERVIEVDSFEELPLGLIKARIASGLSQRDLAERLDLKEQMIQRYEATDYTSASFARLLEIARALGVTIKNELFLPRTPEVTPAMVCRLKQAGVSTTLIERRLLGHQILDDPATSADLAATSQRIFGFSQTELLGAEQLEPPVAPLEAANFKLSKRFNDARLTAYSAYAYYIARLVLAATEPLAKAPAIPRDPDRFREEVVSRFGAFDFIATLRYLWECGAAVVPLSDSGAFHGAFWRIDGRNIIVLKQQVRKVARWHFDLLHESYHSSVHGTANRMVIDSEEGEAGVPITEEHDANRFAGDVLLDRQAEALALEAVGQAQGRLERLKTAVMRVADKHKVDVSSLANYLAWRLSLQNENWWGAASNLQSDSDDPWEIVRDQLLLHLDLSRLDQLDQQILTRALQGADL